MRIKELFTVPEGQKVTEKVFGKVLISSICSILLCMACLVSTTWAWFSLDITSTNNAIQIGEFAVNVSVGNLVNESTEAGTYKYSLTTGVHEVTINAGRSTASGYCIVTLENQEPYRTIRIGGEGNPTEVKFKVTIDQNKIEVTDTTPELTDGSTTPKTVTLTITPVWGAPEDNDGLGSAGQQNLTAAILAEPEETTEPEESTEPEDTTAPTTTATESTTTATEPTTTATESTTTATESTTTATESTTTATELTTEPTGTEEPTETTAAAESEGTAE